MRERSEHISCISLSNLTCTHPVLTLALFLSHRPSPPSFIHTHARFARSYAMLMILVYPIGVPFMYFVLLYRKRAVLDPGQERFTRELGARSWANRRRSEGGSGW